MNQFTKSIDDFAKICDEEMDKLVESISWAIIILSKKIFNIFPFLFQLLDPVIFLIPNVVQHLLQIIYFIFLLL